ncbi:MAG: hypothetical protein IJC29_05335 [Clostridia bacterium]|nr:hypothetical protein [Clostridia bacterium]
MKAFFLKIREKLVTLWTKIAGKCVAFGRGFVAFWCAFGRFFKNLPKNTVTFFKNLPANTKTFFKTMTKDKAINLAVGTGAVIIWSSPVFIIAYVLIWFLSK